jgi:diguanylate cyclase (GGDEF)-like protein
VKNILFPQKAHLITRRSLEKTGILIVLTIVYFYAGKLGLSLAFVNPSATAVWPPAGIALAAFLILGNYAWPAILVGAFLVNLTTSDAVLPSLAIAFGNTFEGFVGATLVNRHANGMRAFERGQDVIKFAILGGMVGPVLSATVGITSLVWGGLATPADILPVWSTWFLGDVTGILIVAPLIILWAGYSKFSWTSARVAEAGFLLLTSILISLAVFSNQAMIGAKNYPLEFLIAPAVIWAAFRFGQRETATITAIISAIAIAGTLQGFGPFARSLPNESLLLLQGFMATVTIMGLVMAALISERRDIESALRASNERLRLSFDGLQQHNEKMILLNEMGDLLQSCSMVDEAYTIIGQLGERLFPHESGALYMINDSQSHVEAAVAWGAFPPEQDAFALDECWALRRGRIHSLYESGLELLCPHMKTRPPLAALCIPMMAQGEAMGIFHLQRGLATSSLMELERPVISESGPQLAKAMADTIALALANLKLRTSLLHQSIRDPLTDLFNRRYLEETLEREVRRASRLQRSVAVVMLDIDHFKNFNDTYSHDAGDTLLRELGHFLQHQIRGGDFACRYGGEEFALIVPEISLPDIRRHAERLREEVKDLRIQYNGGTLETITLSLGVAVFPEHGMNGKAVLHAADAALYEAKRRGRDQVVIASGAPEEISE